jgi:hypothetical protein
MEEGIISGTGVLAQAWGKEIMSGSIISLALLPSQSISNMMTAYTTLAAFMPVIPTHRIL